MGLLVLGVSLFIGIHLLPTMATLRAGCVSRIGHKPYRAVFALVSFIGFGLIVYGKAQAPYVHGFSPPSWGRHVTMLSTLLMAICFAALYLPTNLKRLTAHPMLWGTVFWGGGHLFANGDVASIILFGSFFAFGLFDMWSLNQRGAEKKSEVLPWSKDALVVVLGLINYGLMIFLHPVVIGVGIFPG